MAICGGAIRISQSPVPNPVVVLREEFDDWVVLFNPDTVKALGINPVGGVIWKLINGRRNAGDIAAEIKESFSDVPEAADIEISVFWIFSARMNSWVTVMKG